MNASVLTFTNPGEIDPRAMVTFGVNVKESSSPIGFFGTGLKYALAGILRLDGKVEVWAGNVCYRFETRKETIRGKDFQIVYYYSSSPLDAEWHACGFTLDLGRHWAPWMIYRELFSNALDENGEVALTRGRPRPGWTTIIVECAELTLAHQNRAKYFLETARKPAWENSELQVFWGQSKTLFYKGIAVEELAEPCAFTYNFISHLELTEDRTIKDLWTARYKIAMAAIQLTDKGMVEKLVCAPESSLESQLPWDYTHGIPSPAFTNTVVQLASRTAGTRVAASAQRLAERHVEKVFAPKEAELNPLQQEQLHRAQAFLADLGISISAPICMTRDLSDDVLAVAAKGQIWLSERVFHLGTKQVASALLEEHLHIAQGLKDESRELQTYLFDLVCTLGERLRGEPL